MMICLIILIAGFVLAIILCAIYFPDPGPFGAYEQWREDAKKAKKKIK